MVKTRTRKRKLPNVPANEWAQRPTKATNTRKRKERATVVLSSFLAISAKIVNKTTNGPKNRTAGTTVKKR